MSRPSVSRKIFLAEYKNNAVLHLIAISGVGFIAVQLVWISMIVFATPKAVANHLVFTNVAIGDLNAIRQHWWTVLSYSWSHFGFWEWLSNMLWLYLFGNVVQSLVGYKQIIPLFIYNSLAGALVFTFIQLIPGAAFTEGRLIMGAQTGILGIMVAAITLSPRYRVYFGEYFSVPLLVIAALFLFLTILNTGTNIAALAMLAGSAFMGFFYVILLRAGYRPGEWVYTLFEKASNMLEPDEGNTLRRNAHKRNTVLNAHPHDKSKVSQQRIDHILDKINEKGYQSLTKEEQDILRRSSEE
jgi:membrane associated rhomboid family serine protease